MVRALLDGSKTQTRRMVKPQPMLETDQWCSSANSGQWMGSGPSPATGGTRQTWGWSLCPYGQPGNRLWVRENGWERPERTHKMMREGADTWEPYAYDADETFGIGAANDAYKELGWRRRPSIHMPRWASRIDLEVIGVRVERLQDISETDAWAEGVEAWREGWDAKAAATMFLNGTYAAVETKRAAVAIRLYMLLWESINGRGSWAANPWVWVVEFRRIKP